MIHLRKNLVILFLLISIVSFAQKQKFELSKVEPANWWIGMKNPEIQLLVYGKDISLAKPSLNYQGVSLKEVVSVENPNYLFLTLHISSEAQAGKFPIKFQLGKQEQIFEFELKNRRKPATAYQGFSPADMIYLLMPDRFANGDTSNDSIKGMKQGLNRKDLYGRHGGDIAGIIKNLDYIANMGNTAIWINPLLENDQPQQSYHGYAITDFYKVDARYGTNADYIRMSELCRQKGLKVVMDMVFNHCGSEHWFFKDMPMKDWVHQFPEYTRSNFRLATNIDPYTSKYDSELMTKGWFDKNMPDLNQKNKFLGTYLIQNSIWWIETAELDGIRMDTHPYPHKDFMAKWCQIIMEEYPNFNIVGEVWENKVAVEAYFQTNAPNKDGFNGYLPSLTDFPLCFAISAAFNEADGWENGLAKIYYALTQDLLYVNPMNNVIFLDNHDLTRFATVTNKNLNKMKMGLATLATMRGIPQFFYGTEILMEGPESNHGLLRADMPGGWEGDTKNVFTQTNMSADEIEMMNYTKKLFNWRKTAKVIHQGKLMHFVPENGVYVYFRYTATETVMVILNNKEEAQTIPTKRYAERMTGFTSAKNALTEQIITDLNTLNLPAKSATILELRK